MRREIIQRTGVYINLLWMFSQRLLFVNSPSAFNINHSTSTIVCCSKSEGSFYPRSVSIRMIVTTILRRSIVSFVKYKMTFLK